MAKFRETLCKYYICKGSCSMGKDAEYKGICQHCAKYAPRSKEKHENKKIKYIEKESSKIEY